MFFKTLKKKLGLTTFRPLKRQRGQSLVEMAIAAPILLIMLVGVLEVGWALRGYLVLANVNREATRFAVKTGTLDYSIKDTATVGYDKVLSHTMASLAEGLPLEYFGPETNNSMIISHFVADTQLPCATGAVPYEFDPSCDCTVDDPDDPQWFTRDDFIAYYDGEDGVFPHYAITFGLTQTSRLDFEQQIDEMTLQNNQVTCALLKANSDASLANTANNMIIVENFYDQPQIAGVPFISNQLTDPIPFYTHTAMRIVCSRDGCTESIGPGCEVYPITFHDGIFDDPANPVPGQPIDAFQGSGTGQFGWLTWNPDSSYNNAGYAYEELINPRLSVHDFTDANEPDDHSLSIGDDVSSGPGVMNSNDVDDALEGLVGKTIRVPIYHTGGGTGQNTYFTISHFALITVNRVCLPRNSCPGVSGNDKRIDATFVGYQDNACGPAE